LLGLTPRAKERWGWVYDRSVMDPRWWAEKSGEKSAGSLKKKTVQYEEEVTEN